jgi:hypothetical protein
MMLLYSGTYLTANVVDTMSSKAECAPANTTTASWAKFGAVSGVNLGLSAYKDSQFARAFGTLPARPFPLASFIPFVLRDGLTIFASFNAPPLLTPSLPQALDGYMSRNLLAQMIAPAGMQLLATPLHLLGLDMYNRSGRIPWRDRMQAIRLAWLSSSVARMCRIIPAYGVGGVVNTGIRSALLGSTVDDE